MPRMYSDVQWKASVGTAPTAKDEAHANQLPRSGDACRYMSGQVSSAQCHVAAPLKVDLHEATVNRKGHRRRSQGGNLHLRRCERNCIRLAEASAVAPTAMEASCAEHNQEVHELYSSH